MQSRIAKTWPLLLCFYALAGLFGNPASAGDVFRWRDDFDTALRAQSPDDATFAPPLNAPSSNGTYNPFAPPPTTIQDPFLSSPEMYQPGPPPPLAPLYGMTGPQPYRFGWTPKFDLAYLPSSDTSPDVGNFAAIEWDSKWVYTAPILSDHIFTATPEFGYRNWRASNTFNDDFYRFGLNLQLARPVHGSLGYQIAFNPSLNSDLQSSLGSESVNLDFNGMVFYQLDPVWMLVLGAGYLDRVDDIVIPYAGVVITPNDLWEFRLLFPQGRISRYIGNFWWGSHWLYLAWEYNVQSFQVNTPTDSQNQIQMEDYRLTFGMRSDHPGFSKYIEAGYVFGRNVDYRRNLPGFDISDGFMVRAGIRF